MQMSPHRECGSQQNTRRPPIARSAPAGGSRTVRDKRESKKRKRLRSEAGLAASSLLANLLLNAIVFFSSIRAYPVPYDYRRLGLTVLMAGRGLFFAATTVRVWCY